MEVIIIKRYYILIFLVLVICFSSLTATSANNDTITAESDSLNEAVYDNAATSSLMDTYAQSTDNITTKNIEKDYNKKSDLKTSSDIGRRDDLVKLLNDASEGSTVYLEKDYIYNTNPWKNISVPINKTLTIDGQGHTLNGINEEDVLSLTEYGMSFFTITADNVVLRNITFINSFSRKTIGGVAIDWIANNGILENCIFKNNTSDSIIRGVVHVTGDKFIANNCYFEKNAAYMGAGFYLNSKNSHISNCTFNGNYGFNMAYANRTNNPSAGSGVYIHGNNNVIENCTFLNQSTLCGTICIDGENNLIKNNILRNNFVYKNGGAIYITQSNNIITGCIIESNTAKENGGAIYINEENNKITDCEISSNSATEGGAIYINEENNKITDCEISSNSATEGGAIYINDKNNEIINCEISSNSATEGGAIYINKQDNNVYSCIIHNNRVSGYGGAIYVDAKNNKINNNIFINNSNSNLKNKKVRDDIYSSVKITADNNWWGNVNTDVCDPFDVYMENKYVKPSTNNNKVTVNSWYYLDVVDKSNNTIPKEINIMENEIINIFDFKFMFKVVNGKEKFIYPEIGNEFNLTGYNLKLHDGDIYQDKLTREFAGDTLAFNIRVDDSKPVLRLDNSLFGVEVPFRFKNIYTLSRLQNIIDNVWENDSAYIYDDYKYDSSVDANMINGITVNKTITIDGKGATIDLDHKARGFYVTSDNVIFKNITIKNANAYNGAAITFTGNGGTVDNSTFLSNFAETNGGAIYSYGEDVFINNSVFDRNYAAEKGAALYSNGKFFRYSNNIFTNNQAKNGRSVCVEGPNYYLFSGWDNNTYENNSYLDYGGNADDTIKPHIIKGTSKRLSKNTFKSPNKITIITSNNKKIESINNQITLGVLNQIFNQNFTNGHLLVYIDGKLVFNATTTDDLTQLIYDLTNLLSGNHEIRVEFTDNEGNTNSYTENITINS